jgi:branched-chain amino acid transport system substrate-binding protein
MRARRGLGVSMAAVAALVLVASACGSSKSSSNTSATSTAGSAPAAGSTSKGAPFKIGYIEEAVSLGSGSSEPYTIPAFQAWVDYANAHGGINGHQVNLIAMREPSNPGIALTDVQKMVHQGIVALVEDDVSDADAWVSYIAKAGVPVFSATSPSLTLAENPIDFSTNTSLLLTPLYTAMGAVKIGAPRMAAFYCAEIPTCKQSVPALSAEAKTVGASVAFSASILGSAPNFISQCLTAKQAGAQSLWVADASTILLRVAASCAQQGYTPHEITSTEDLQQNFAGAPGMDGLIAADGYAPFFDTSFPGVATMRAAFQQYDPSLLKLPEYGDLSTQQWTTGLLIAAAAQAGGVGSTNPLTPAAMLNSLYTLHSTDLGGMTPTMTFTKGQSQQNKCWFWVEIQNNKYTLPDGLTPTCAS